VTATDPGSGLTGAAFVKVQAAPVPVITCNSPADITYGTPLGPTQLDATADAWDAACLHRGAHPSGRAFRRNAPQVSLSETAVANAFLTSDDYFQAHRHLTTSLNGLYADVLGRSPDAADTATAKVT
jgi:hypothetical protein